MRARRWSWIGNLILAAAAALLALLLAEVGLRVTGHRMVFPQMFVEDPHTVYRLKPSVKERTINEGYFDYEYTVNSQSLRAVSDVAIPKPHARPRILFVGNSFTFGVGVDDSATYPARVDARLGQWCDVPVETVNGGVGGFDNSRTLLFLQHYGWRLEPNVVVLGFVTGDPVGNSRNGLHRLIDGRLEEIPASERPGWGLIRAHRHIPGYTWLVRHSTLFNWTRLQIAELLTQRAESREAARIAVPTAHDDTGGAQLELQRWQLTAAIFERIRAQADSHGAKLVVAIIPEGSTLTTYYTSGRPVAVEGMLQLCRQQGLTCIDVAESIKRADPTANPRSFYLREGHFNATGYDLVAEPVARRLAEELKCTPR